MPRTSKTETAGALLTGLGAALLAAIGRTLTAPVLVGRWSRVLYPARA